MKFNTKRDILYLDLDRLLVVNLEMAGPRAFDLHLSLKLSLLVNIFSIAIFFLVLKYQNFSYLSPDSH